jgi:spore coat polysaccharide biosynthesis predicted glycosyltransferase SpsG
MDNADFLVSAGGTTLYELCAVGTPAVSYSIADNQLDNVKMFHENGIIDYAGDVRYDDVVKNILKYLELYCDNEVLRRDRSKKMQKLIDGKGAGRIAEFLREYKVGN